MPFETTRVPATAGRPRYHQYSDDAIRELIDALEKLPEGQGIKLGEYAEESVARGQARAAQRQLAQHDVTVGTSVWEVDDNGSSRFVSAIHPSTRTDSRDTAAAYQGTEHRFRQEPVEHDRRRAAPAEARRSVAVPQAPEPGDQGAVAPQVGQDTSQAGDQS